MSRLAPTRIVVVAIGHPYGGDDAVALAVLAELAERWRTDGRVRCVELDGEPTRIVDAWRGADEGWLVDAVRSGDRPGTCREIDLAQLGALSPATGGGGTHAAGAAEAMALGRALGVLPRRVRIFGIEGSSFEPSERLSRTVRSAGLPAAVALVDGALRRALAGDPRG